MTQPFLQLTMDTYVLPAAPQAPRAASSAQPSKVVAGNNGRRYKAGARTSARANEIIHTSRSSGHRRERDWSLRHRRTHVCVLWLGDGRPCALSAKLSRTLDFRFR